MLKIYGTYDPIGALIVIALTASAMALFGMRLLIRGTVRFDRVNAVGGSPLLSKRLVEMGYWAILPLARRCVAAGITPNHITWASLGLGIASGVCMAVGLQGLGALFALLSVLGDILDGQVAREAKSGSAAGEVLDASVDRYMEFFFVGGLVVFYRHNAVLMIIALAAMLATFMVSYSTAKAEAMGVDPPRGAMRRHERSTYFISGAVFSSMLGPWLEPFAWMPDLKAPPMMVALAIVAVAGNVSAVRRLVLISRALRERDAKKMP